MNKKTKEETAYGIYTGLYSLMYLTGLAIGDGVTPLTHPRVSKEKFLEDVTFNNGPEEGISRRHE